MFACKLKDFPAFYFATFSLHRYKTPERRAEIQHIRRRQLRCVRKVRVNVRRRAEIADKPEHMQINKSGRLNRYSGIKPVYSLNILGYNHFDDEDALRIFELYDPERNKRFEKRLLRLGYFELNKPRVETLNQKHWYDYFKTGTRSKLPPNACFLLLVPCVLFDNRVPANDQQWRFLPVFRVQNAHDAQSKNHNAQKAENRCD